MRQLVATLSMAALLGACGSEEAPRARADAAGRSTTQAELGDGAVSRENGDGGVSGESADARAPSGPPEIVIAAAGDVLVHRRVAEAAASQSGRFRHVLAALGDTLRELESRGLPVLAMVNLETPLTEARLDPVNTNPPVLGSPPELAADLASLGVDVVSLANNHAMDQTPEGLLDSLRVAAAAGLGTVGAGVTDEEARGPWITERGGLRVGVLGFAGHVNRGAGGGAERAPRVALIRDEEPMLDAVRALRPRVDVVVVALHWSHDFVRGPTAAQRALAGRLIDAGADVLIGTGPHVLHPVERRPSPRGEAVVAYSLGNLISNQGLRHRVGERAPRGGHPVAYTAGTRDAPLLALRLRIPAPGRVEVLSVEAAVMWVVNNFWERRGRTDVPLDLRLIRLRDGSEELRRDRLAAVGEALGPAVRLIP